MPETGSPRQPWKSRNHMGNFLGGSANRNAIDEKKIAFFSPMSFIA